MEPDDPAADKMSLELALRLAQAQPGDRLAVIVTLTEQFDLRGVATVDEAQRSEDVITGLQDTATASQDALQDLLFWRRLQGSVERFTPFWIVNAIAMTAEPDVIREVAARPEVLHLEIDDGFLVPAPSGAPSEPPEPNLAQVHADVLWDLGFTGDGIVVATVDTGVDVTHPDLAGRWRGGTNSWFDAFGEHPSSPTDLSGHGTWVMGLLVGGGAGGTTVGVAPDAQWIAARIFDDEGQSTLSAVHAAYQWILDPDSDPSTDDAPDVVNNSWAFGSAGCNLTFQSDLQALRATGILPVFSAGNTGPTVSLNASPPNNPEAFSVGSVDLDDVIAFDSGRGPSTCGSTARTFPDTTAPGVAVRSTDLSALYMTGEGTSFAAPHAAGTLALLLDAFPDLTVTEQDAALREGVVDLGDAGADDTYGFGRIDALGSYGALTRARIGGLIFDDLDGDGVREDGEPGLGVVRVVLTGPGPDSALGTADDVVFAETLTDGAGGYVFLGLGPGRYRVAVDGSAIPAGYVLTTGNGHYDAVLANGQEWLTGDFGYRLPPSASVGDLVFDDVDGDGLRAAEEPGLAGIWLLLTGAGTDGALGTADDVALGDAVTDVDGAYGFGGLEAGVYRVAFDAATVPAGDVLTTGAERFDVALLVGEAFVDADFGFGPDVYGTITGVVFDDTDRDGTRDGSELGLAGGGVALVGAGPDGTPGNVDDLPLGESATDEAGIYSFPDLPAGTYRLTVDPTTLGPDRVLTTANQPLDVVLAAGSDLLAGDVGYGVPTVTLLFFSGVANGSVGGVDFGDEDIVSFDGAGFAMVFDGSDVGAGAGDVDGFERLDADSFLLSFNGVVTLPAVGAVDDSDVVRFDASSLGPSTAGTFSLYFDGSDVGLDVDNEDVDAVQVLAGGDLLVSVAGTFSLPGASGGDEDLVRFTPTSLGDTTSGTFALFFDGSDVGMATTADEDVDGAFLDAAGDLYLSTLGDFAVTGVSGADEDVFRFTPTSLGATTTGTFSSTLRFDGSTHGLTTNDLDTIDQATVAAPEPPTTTLLFFSALANGSVGGVDFGDEDIVSFDGTNFAMVFDGSDVGAAAGDVDGFERLDADSLLLSFNDVVTLPGAGVVDDSDVVRFDASSFGPATAGTFSLYFDGSDVGLDVDNDDVDAVQVLAGGDLLLSVAGTFAWPGASGGDEDLVQFTPTSLGDTTSGTFALFFDGSDVGLATTADEDVDGAFIDAAGDLYLSTLGDFGVTGVSGADDDVFRFRPTSLGTTTTGTFASTLRFDGSAHGLTTNDLDAIDQLVE